MKRRIVMMGSVLSLLIFKTVRAENIRLNEVVVTATRNAVQRPQIPAAVTVITQEDISAKQSSTVADILKDIPGLDVVQQGGPGQTTSVFIRGAESRHTLVLIDGIRVNSPTMGGFDFADMNVNDIERIEIVRSPLSTLYGSDAIGGVIQIFTKKALTSSGSMGFESGYYDTEREDVSTSLRKERYDLNITASHLKTEGFSASKAGNEKDGYKNTTVASHFGMAAGATGRLDLTANLTESRTDLDSFNVDDPDYQQQRQWTLLGLTYNSGITGDWSQHLSLSSSEEEFIYSDVNIPLNRGRFNTVVKSAEWQNNIHSSDDNELTFGYEWQQQQGDIQGGYNKRFSDNAVYIQDHRGLKSPLQVLAGLRWDNSSIYKSAVTYRAGISQTPSDGIKWYAQYGTGFKGPNLNDLFRPEDLYSLGNPNLKPEKSKGWEVGTEQIISDTMSMSLSYYNNVYEDMIQWIPNASFKSQPQNRSNASSKGVETNIVWQPSQLIRIDGNYTYNETEDSESHFYLQRRPLNKYGIVFLVNPAGVMRMNININHSGRRVEWADTDSDGKPDKQNMMSAYTKVDMGGSYNISSTTEIFFRIENLFNVKYEEAIGYNTAGFSSYGGVKIVL